MQRSADRVDPGWQAASGIQYRRWQMRNKFQSSSWLVLGLLLTIPLWAHHSITSEFDTSKSITVKGTLTKIEWVNPHAYVYMEAKEEKGEVTQYSSESGPPGILRRAGDRQRQFRVRDTG